MEFSTETCKQLVGSGSFGNLMSSGIADICDCFGTNPSDGNEKCKCDDFKNNQELQSAIEKLKNCSGTNSDLTVSMPNTLSFLTNSCYLDTLSEILSSLKNDKFCNVDVSAFKNQGQQILTYARGLGGTVNGALQFVQKIKNVFASAKQFFMRIIEKFPGYDILLPFGMLIFILIIIKLFRCIFCRPRKENKEDYNEQMKQLQEQYNRTLQTSAQLNNYLIGYQNI
ncbi:PIR protein [Plasmodium ovale]|uniref:PIR protein n=1 Tax=Plasmodium ovale TaxID=36330 RepID=A0A1C3KKQ0_PLAOA|nr:PIR protein [Plasmodium ovale]